MRKIFLLFFLCGYLISNATEYFVSTTGSDTASGLDWANALLTPSNAATKATSNGDIITISNGVYNVVTQINLTVANVSVRSFGNGTYGGLSNASNTIINVSGGGGNRRCWYITTSSTVDGFIARGARRASGTMLGGGIYMSAGTVQNCIISNCFGDTMYGQGVYLDGGNLLNSYILGNGPAGSDRARGGGVYINNSSAIVSNCVIARCGVGAATTYGGGVNLQAGLITHCVIASNEVNGSGGLGAGLYIVGGIARNCVIVKNLISAIATGVNGAGIFQNGGLVESCTIVDNIAISPYSLGAGVYRDNNGVITNSIILYNYCTDSGKEINYSRLSSANTSYTLTTPALGGNNISGDQFFVKSSEYDYSIYPGPAMDAGTNLAWMTGATDILGNPRTNGVNNRVDIGAYEIVPSRLMCGFVATNSVNILTTSSVVFRAYVSGTNTTITGYVWNFGDGDILGSSIITNTFSSAGLYTISLQVTNELSEVCTTIKSNYITVWNPIVYAWTNSPNATKPYTNWSTAARKINDIIYTVPNGVTIIATNGTFTEKGTVELNNSINLTSFIGGLSGASNTIIRPAYTLAPVVSVNNSGAILDGFTVRDAAGGSGFFGRNVTLVAGTLRNCIVRNGIGDNVSGKGINMSGGLVSNCLITANNIGGGSGDGAGIYATGGTVVNSIISDNIGNARNGAGVYHASGSFLLRNCLILNNRPSALGGGIYLSSGGIIESCTIVSNACTGAGGGGGVYRVSGTAGSITNSIVYNNIASASIYSNIYATSANGITFTCTTNPTIAGTGCISLNPLFVSTTTVWTLQANSPCINTGTNLSWMTGAIDLAGNPRLTDGLVDMGAYEYLSITPVTIIPSWYFYRPNRAFNRNIAIKNQETPQ